MNAALPKVTLDDHNSVPSLSVVHWDQESMVLSISILSEPPSAESTADVINRSLGIGQSQGRVVIGDLDVMVDSRGQILSMEIRTNPQSWVNEAIPALSDSFATASMRFPVAFDDNDIATYDVPVRISVDRQRRVVRLKLGNTTSAQWARLAPEIVVGVTAQGHFSEVRLLNFAVPSV